MEYRYQDTATALLYGLKMDTLQFTRGVNEPLLGRYPRDMIRDSFLRHLA